MLFADYKINLSLKLKPLGQKIIRFCFNSSAFNFVSFL